RVLVGRMMISLLGIPTPGGASSPGGADAVPSDDDALAAFATGERLASIALGSAGSTYLSAEQAAAAREIVAELTRGVPDGWRHAPTDRLLGRCRELGLGLEETTGLASLRMVAGTETSACARARTTALLVHTGEQHRLLRLPAGAQAGRGGLRAPSPASVRGRGAAAAVGVAGRPLRAGERVMILTWAANAGVGPFRANRPYVRETRQLWFGAGRHLCLGAALARA